MVPFEDFVWYVNGTIFNFVIIIIKCFIIVVFRYFIKYIFFLNIYTNCLEASCQWAARSSCQGGKVVSSYPGPDWQQRTGNCSSAW